MVLIIPMSLQVRSVACQLRLRVKVGGWTVIESRVFKIRHHTVVYFNSFLVCFFTTLQAPNPLLGFIFAVNDCASLLFIVFLNFHTHAIVCTYTILFCHQNGTKIKSLKLLYILLFFSCCGLGVFLLPVAGDIWLSWLIFQFFWSQNSS